MISSLAACGIRGDVNYVAIGARTNISVMAASLHQKSYQVFPSNPHGNPLIITAIPLAISMLHGCTIGNRVLVGMGSIVLMARQKMTMIGAEARAAAQTAGKRLFISCPVCRSAP